MENKRESGRVKREEWDTPSGAHAVSVELELESAAAANAVKVLVDMINDTKKHKSVEEVAGRTNWAGGYIAALVVAGMIKPNQADELQKIADITAKCTLNGAGWEVRENRTREKRG